MTVEICSRFLLGTIYQCLLSDESVLGFVSPGVIDALKSQVGKTQVGAQLCSSIKPYSMDLDNPSPSCYFSLLVL